MNITSDFDPEELKNEIFKNILDKIREIVASNPCPVHGTYATVIENHDADNPWSLDCCCEVQENDLERALETDMS